MPISLACSRLSVVGSEKRESERKTKGGLTPRLSPPLLFFSLVFAHPQLPRAWNRLQSARIEWTKLIKYVVPEFIWD